jgi:von Willebrand factor type A domain
MHLADSEKKDEQRDSASDLSSTLPFIPTEHAQMRRKQRGIAKKDLKAALIYGTRTPHSWGKHRIKAHKVFRYTYNNIVYIVDESVRREITCYAKPTKLYPAPISPERERFHNHAYQKIRYDLSSWTSHTVMVIDTSGSMRTSDVWGARNRLNAVWLAIAQDFLARRLEGGVATFTDVVSIITMGEHPEILFREVPTT